MTDPAPPAAVPAAPVVPVAPVAPAEPVAPGTPPPPTAAPAEPAASWRRACWLPVRDLLLLLLLNAIGGEVLARVRLADVLLSPAGADNPVVVFLAVVCLGTRFFLLTLAPGWVLARVVLALWPATDEAGPPPAFP